MYPCVKLGIRLEITIDLNVWESYLHQKPLCLHTEQLAYTYSMCLSFSFPFSNCLSLHPHSSIPLLYLPFTPKSISPSLFSSCSSLLSLFPSICLSFFPYLPSVSSPFFFLCLCLSSGSLPRSLPLLVLSKNPGSHLISSLHVVTPTMTKTQWGLTFPWLVAVLTVSLLSHGISRVMYLPASKHGVAGGIKKTGNGSALPCLESAD